MVAVVFSKEALGENLFIGYPNLINFFKTYFIAINKRNTYKSETRYTQISEFIL
jgi:hypothetical protein